MSGRSQAARGLCLLRSLLSLLLAWAAAPAGAGTGVGVRPRASRRALAADAGVPLVGSSAELAAALADTRVTACTVTQSFRLNADDWGEAIELQRNFTVAGPDADPSTWPTLDLAYLRERVVLYPGVVLTLTYVVLANVGEAPLFQAPGINLFAGRTATDNGSSTAAPTSPLLIMTDGAMVEPSCLPAAFLGALTALMDGQRPRRLPSGGAAVVVVPQDGCVNSTTAPAAVRCWTGRQMGLDAGFPAQFLDRLGLLTYAGYDIWANRMAILCERPMTEACVAEYGLLGCHIRVTSAANTSLDGDARDASSSIHGVPLPAVNSAAANAPKADEGTDGASGSKSPTRTCVLAGVFGGTALLLVVALAAWMVHRRRAPTACDSPVCKPPKRSGSTPDAAPPSVCVVTTGGLSTDTPAGTDTMTATGSRCSACVHPEHSAAVGLQGAIVLPLHDDESLVPVTRQTPMAPGVELGVSGEELDNALELLPRILGKGATGRVVEGRWRSQAVAVKLLDLGLATAGAAQPDQCEKERRVMNAQLSLLKQEVEVLARCRHPNVVRLLAANLSASRPCLVMELMDCSLGKLLCADGEGKPVLLPLPKVIYISLQVAQALAYLHPTILHRDLKPDNILLLQPDSPKPVVKLADFGLSRLRTTTLVTERPEVGTVPYMAPELFDVNSSSVTDRADIYSLALVIWQLIAGEPPWAYLGPNPVALAFNIASLNKRPPLDHLPAERLPLRLRRLLVDMWQRDPQGRPAAAEVVKRLLLVEEALMLRALPATPPSLHAAGMRQEDAQGVMMYAEMH